MGSNSDQLALFNQYDDEYCSKSTAVATSIQKISALGGGEHCPLSFPPFPPPAIAYNPEGVSLSMASVRMLQCMPVGQSACHTSVAQRWGVEPMRLECRTAEGQGPRG